MFPSSSTSQSSSCSASSSVVTWGFIHFTAAVRPTQRRIHHGNTDLAGNTDRVDEFFWAFQESIEPKSQTHFCYQSEPPLSWICSSWRLWWIKLIGLEKRSSKYSRDFKIKINIENGVLRTNVRSESGNKYLSFCLVDVRRLREVKIQTVKISLF